MRVTNTKIALDNLQKKTGGFLHSNLRKNALSTLTTLTTLMITMC